MLGRRRSRRGAPSRSGWYDPCPARPTPHAQTRSEPRRRRWVNPRLDREDSPELLGLLNLLYDLLEQHGLELDFPFPIRVRGGGKEAFMPAADAGVPQLGGATEDSGREQASHAALGARSPARGARESHLDASPAPPAAPALPATSPDAERPARQMQRGVHRRIADSDSDVGGNLTDEDSVSEVQAPTDLCPDR